LIAAAVIIVIAAIAGVGAAVNLKRRKRKPV
jgi:thioredoxin reductase